MDVNTLVEAENRSKKQEDISITGKKEWKDKPIIMAKKRAKAILDTERW